MTIPPAVSDPLIEARGIHLARRGRYLLSDVSVAVGRGEIVTLIGPNGAGKTSIVRIMLGLLRPDAGTVARRPGLTIGYVPQRLSLDPTLPMTVSGFLDLGLRPFARAVAERRRRVMAEVGVGEVMDASLHDISGGELQRVMLARALLRDPGILVLDEPAQGVDITGQAEIYELIARLRRERGVGVLLVSHDLHLVMAATDHVVCLNGHVCCAGTPDSVSRDPAFAALFGDRAASALAIYHHRHDHIHDPDGKTHAVDHDCGHDHPPTARKEIGHG